MSRKEHNRKNFNRLIEDLPELDASQPIPDDGAVHDNDCVIFKRGEHLFIVAIDANDELLLTYNR